MSPKNCKNLTETNEDIKYELWKTDGKKGEGFVQDYLPCQLQQVQTWDHIHQPTPSYQK
jgi:hypothetical protein